MIGRGFSPKGRFQSSSTVQSVVGLGRANAKSHHRAQSAPFSTSRAGPPAHVRVSDFDEDLIRASTRSLLPRRSPRSGARGRLASGPGAAAGHGRLAASQGGGAFNHSTTGLFASRIVVSPERIGHSLSFMDRTIPMICDSRSMLPASSTPWSAGLSCITPEPAGTTSRLRLRL